MKILSVGDLIGEIGLNKARETIEKIRKEENIDFIIVNGENVAEGMGITLKNFNIFSTKLIIPLESLFEIIAINSKTSADKFNKIPTIKNAINTPFKYL